ncbi:MAG: hypothetical protein NW224_18315 [Leptolyngbyaceae cyanobacterium bins.302]|nr:hypothetical protein [Leptolyngbyaceae cyanobacterium bins.302]
MGSRKLFSNYTVPDDWVVAGWVRGHLNALSDITRFCLLLGSSLCFAGSAWAGSPDRTHDSAPHQISPTPSSFVESFEDTAAIPEPLSTSVLPTFSPATLFSSSVTSKANFLATSASHQAADLALPTVDGQVKAQAIDPSVLYHSRSREWVVAAAQLPLLETVPELELPDDLRVESAPVGFNSSETQESSPISPPPAAPPFLIAADPANPTLPPVFTCPNPDPELGCLRLQDFPGSTSPAPILYLIPRFDFFRSNNLLLGIDPINDGLIRPTLTLLAVPPLGPDTYILASVEGAFNRYFKVPIFNYDELRIRAGLLQRLSPTMTAEIGWTNQQLFIANNEIRGFPAGTRFLNDQAVRFELSRRDQLSDRLFLNSIYQFRAGFSEPKDRSRILNVLFLSLNYDLNPKRTVQFGIDYQFSAANYTVVQRTDIYQQLLGRITWSAFPNSQMSVYSGISFGDSTEPGINFTSYVLGLSISVNIVLF